jgi:UDP-N-acetylmuramoylalanine--D-glutamate ligase
LSGKKIALWGAGRETVALVDAVARMGIDCEFTGCVIERPAGTLAERRIAAAMPVTRRGAAGFCRDADVVVRSPWVQTTRRALRAAAERGVTITTSSSLWLCEHAEVPLIAVTGTKGKTTTTLMIAAMLRAAGERVVVGGNIGNALCAIDDMQGVDRIVAELSSFQTSDLARAPEIFVVTNLLSDHDAWHGSQAKYHADKLRPLTLGGTHRLIYAPLLDPLPGDVVAAPGRHNRINAAAALAAARAAGHGGSRANELLKDFRMPAERLERVVEIDGVRWLDDAHSTCIESICAATEAVPARRHVFVSGGRPRGSDGRLVTALAATGSSLVGYGEFADELAGAPGADEVFEPAADFGRAVARASQIAAPGDAVIHCGIARVDHGYTLSDRSSEFQRHVRELAASGGRAARRSANS